MRYKLLLQLLLCGALVACQSRHVVNEGDQVDITDIIDAYKSDPSDPNLEDVPETERIRPMGMVFKKDTLLMTTSGSTPFLKVAVDAYNSFMILHNVYRDVEIYERWSDLNDCLNEENLDDLNNWENEFIRQKYIFLNMDITRLERFCRSKEGQETYKSYLKSQMKRYQYVIDAGTLVPGIKQYNTSVIKDKKMRASLDEYKTMMLELVERDEPWDDTRNPVNAYKYSYNGILPDIHYPDGEKMEKSREEAMTRFIEMGFELLNDALSDCEGDSLLRVMSAINDCGSFEEQCAMAMASIPMFRGDDTPWVLCIMKSLLDSGYYMLLLQQFWHAWRVLYQFECCGLSIDSSIPNSYYNSMKKKVFAAYIRHLEANPDDEQAFYATMKLLIKRNLCRYGDVPGGNEALTEMQEFYGDASNALSWYR